MKFNYKIEGMHCEACIEKIRKVISSKYQISKLRLNPPLLEIDADHEPDLNTLNSDISQAGKYKLQNLNSSEEADHPTEEAGWRSYYPLLLIIAYITLVASLNNFSNQSINWHGWMNQVMAGFFLVFSAFKFLDLRGFADGYSTYDLLAKRWHFYGFIYPFLELGLAILYIGQWFPTATALLTIIIMGFSSLGVINSLIKKQKFKCACLGTILNVPLSSITLVEDLTMVFLAVISLFF